MDETGWNVAAQLRWLWVAVSEQVTFCDILPGRGFDEAASILGADYKGWLTHDGWQVYYKFLKAGHQSRSEEHTSELQSRLHLVCRLLLEKKKNSVKQV